MLIRKSKHQPFLTRTVFETDSKLVWIAYKWIPPLVLAFLMLKLSLVLCPESHRWILHTLLMVQGALFYRMTEIPDKIQAIAEKAPNRN